MRWRSGIAGARLVTIADFIEHAATSVNGERAEYAFMKACLHVGALLDPKLISCFAGVIRILYFDRNKPNLTGDAEVAPTELISGLMLSRNVVSTAGVLLLQKGDELDSASISLIRGNSQMASPSERGVWVYINNPE